MGAQKVAWSQNRAPNTGITRERVDGIKYMFVKKDNYFRGHSKYRFLNCESSKQQLF